MIQLDNYCMTSQIMHIDKKTFIDDTMDQNEVPTMIDQDDLVAVQEGEEDLIEHAADHILDRQAEISETNCREEAVIIPEEAVILINYLFCNNLTF